MILALSYFIWVAWVCFVLCVWLTIKPVAIMEEFEEEERLLLNPVVLELHRLQSLLKAKNEELSDAHTEIKSLRATQTLKTKAIEELENKVTKQDDKLRFIENLLQHKNLEIKKLTDEKKDALTAQFAAESTLRRVHSNQKDDDFPFPIEAVIAPLESELKLCKDEMNSLQENMKAMERHTKSKEAALVETEKILSSALERALIVEEIQNHNIELKRQIEIYKEENKVQEKLNRQRVVEIEKMTQTINQLEEALLNGGAAANTVRDCRRQITQLNEEKRILERELARAKVAANRLATAVANDWKSEDEKAVMPVKIWLQERRFLQTQMKRLKEKLSISERTAKAESLLKDKFKLRLNTLEEGLRNHFCIPKPTHEETKSEQVEEDSVSGFLYDTLQKEVIHLRKVCLDKESIINAKDEEIKMLMKKVEASMMKPIRLKPRK